MNESNEALEARKGKGTNGFTPCTFGGSVALWRPWFLPCETHFGFLTSRIVRKSVCVVSGQPRCNVYRSHRKPRQYVSSLLDLMLQGAGTESSWHLAEIQ